MGIMFEIAPMCRAASKGCCNLFSCFSSPNVTFLRKRAHSQILERYPRGNFALKGSWELNFCFKTETKVCCLSKLLCQSIQDTACLSHSLLNSLWIQICIPCSDRFSSTFAALPRPSCYIDNITK